MESKVTETYPQKHFKRSINWSRTDPKSPSEAEAITLRIADKILRQLGYVMYSESRDSESKYYCLPNQSKTRAETIRVSAHPPDMVVTKEPVNVIISTMKFTGDFISARPMDVRALKMAISKADMLVRTRVKTNSRWLSRTEPLIK